MKREYPEGGRAFPNVIAKTNLKRKRNNTMITKLLHQIWNERKQNAWLFIELIIASLFLWLALDPLYTMICRKNIPTGCDVSDVYLVELSHYKPGDTRCKPEYYLDSELHESCRQAINIIRSMPEVENHTITDYGNWPNSYMIGSSSYIADSVDFEISGKSFEEIEKEVEERKITPANIVRWQYNRTEGGSYPATFGIKDIHTGEHLNSNISRYANGVYISENAATALFGTTDAAGKRFRDLYQGYEYQVAGVFKDVTLIQYDEHLPLFITEKGLTDDDFSSTYNDVMTFLHIRVKKGVDKVEFEKRFREEIMPRLQIGNVYCKNITSHIKIARKYENMFGITNKYRLCAGLSAFALFCAFLGLFSSFWIRTAERRGDIGIMRSIGASRSRIIRQFACEALMLTTVAFAVAMPFVMHYLHIEGFADPLKQLAMISKSTNSAYLHNQPVTHFIAVSVATYIFMATIAVIGAVIPAWRTTRIIPADALRDE